MASPLWFLYISPLYRRIGRKKKLTICTWKKGVWSSFCLLENIPISCKYPGENTFEIQLAHNSEIIFITKKVNARGNADA